MLEITDKKILELIKINFEKNSIYLEKIDKKYFFDDIQKMFFDNGYYYIVGNVSFFDDEQSRTILVKNVENINMLNKLLRSYKIRKIIYKNA